jgi:hypothetical protein
VAELPGPTQGIGGQGRQKPSDIDQLLADDHLEVYEVAESDEVTGAGDGVNPCRTNSTRS